MIRWFLFWILCIVMVVGNGCTRLEAAPAPIGPTPKAITTEAMHDYVVVSTDGTEIGPVDGVIISTETGNTQYVVVFIKDIYNYGKGAIYGPQDHYLPIPWSHLKLNAASQQLVVDVAANFIKGAPDFTVPPDTSLAGWDNAIALYWTK